MKSPLTDGKGWLEREEVDSTQDLARNLLLEDAPYGIVLALDQKRGRGRFDRTWVSAPGDSLTMSLIFRPYTDHPAPHLIGMALAISAAAVIHCQLQWPNDLTLRQKKVGGLLTELRPDNAGKLVPIVGLGINLNQQTFPEEIAERAVSLSQATGLKYDARELAQKIVDHLATLPEPDSWATLAPIWRLFDDTPGKPYTLPSGEIGNALTIGQAGELVCTVEGEPRTVMAADAIFG
jgi:BirA family biotin operon repressor/biotin-[acetyl-CoA-carboxylase] ligase